MNYKLIIDGTLPGLNDYIDAINSNRHKGNELKQNTQELIIWAIRQQLRGVHIEIPIILEYDFYEPNRKRDLDNISAFAHKTIQDSLVLAGVIKNDGWKNIKGYKDRFFVDKVKPRIEVTLVEAGD